MEDIHKVWWPTATPRAHYTTFLVVTAHYILKCSVVWLSCRYGVVCLVFGRRLALVGHHNKVDRACNFGVAMTLKKRRLKLTLWVQTIKDKCMQRDINIEVDIACRYCHLRQVWRLAQSSTCCNTSKAVNTRFWSRRQLPRRDSTCRSATTSFAICTLLTTLLAFSLAVRHCHGIFTARRYSSAVLATARCLYLSVCLSQVGIVSKRGFLQRILRCVVRKLRYLRKSGYFSLKLCFKPLA